MAQRGKEWLAPMLFKASCTAQTVLAWLEKMLLKELTRPSVIIMDNATFHKGGRIQELIESSGCRILYLPPYSPDLNRIEKCWAWLKSRIRHRLHDYSSLRMAIESVLKDTTS